MGFKNFRFNILYRVFLLICLLLAMVWGFSTAGLELTPIVCGVLSLLSVIELIHYVEKNNRKLQRFLDFIHHNDFSSISINEELGKSFADLSDAYQLISTAFQSLNAEKQASAQYLGSVVEHVNIALIGLETNGDISLMNSQAKRLFQTPYLPNIEAINKVDKKLVELIRSLRNNEHKLINIKIGNESLNLAVHAIEFQLLNKNHQLISFQNIRDELEQHEISSWQKLIKVLTHEIMNSVTPIISLSGLLKEKLIINDSNNSIAELSTEEIEDIQQSLHSIESRSKGLQRFVQTYRRLSAIPRPTISTIKVSALLSNVQTLMLPELEKCNIKLLLSGDIDELSIHIDPQQIEQVLINLLKNAMEALTNTANPFIRILVEKNKNDLVLMRIEDNGPGIDPAYLDQIFVPFFTTKENGNGIGLSISRQIMIQNKGALSVHSNSEDGCSLLMQFH